MANSITLTQKYTDFLDAAFKQMALTGRFETPAREANFSGTPTVKVRKMSAVGLGNYSRSAGWPAGNLTVSWETITLAYERGRGLSLDAMDADEAMTEIGEVIGEYQRLHIVPEVDAYRFSKWASNANVQTVGTPASLNKDTILGAIDAAKDALDTYEVPQEGRVLFIESKLANALDSAVTRIYANESGVDRRVTSLDGIEIVRVPQGRFYKGITLDAGAAADAGGYSKTPSTGRDINFILAHPQALGAVVKHAPMYLFPPGSHTETDGWLVKWRLYGDAWVWDEKAKGVYVHLKAS